ncbi:MAG TPA: nucleotidyltransferase family protein [Candidatus Acidoferrales bacterium]|nr:nucleotidyltransferase family protein [Candidatus Acidoferrales bacterium]
MGTGYHSAAKAVHRAENALLLCCARSQLEAEGIEQVRGLLGRQLDWTYLFAAASWHGLMPHLYWHLNACCPGAVPPSRMAVLANCFREHAQRNLYLTLELVGILERLQANEVLAIPYKGPVLAFLAYGGLALREFSDLDILVPQRDIPRACKLVASLGYQPRFEPAAAHATSKDRIPGQYLFSRDDGSSVVELHSERTLRYFPRPLDVDRISARLEPVSVGGKEVHTFPAEDLLSLLCVHGAKHFWQRLSWISDIAELLRSHPGLDWGRTRELARELDCERMLFLGLYLARDLLGANLSEEILADQREERVLHSLAGRVCAKLFWNPATEPGVIERCGFRIRMRERLWDGLRYSLRMAVTPTEEDWALLPLPDRLNSLYYVIRPLRLLKKYGMSLGRRSRPKNMVGSTGS